MNNHWILAVSGVAAVYFGLQTLRILPTVVRLISALRSGSVVWPGPIIQDLEYTVRVARQRLGAPPQYLFTSFFKHALGVVAAFSMSVLLILNVFFLWIVPLEGKEWIAFGLPLFAVIVGGRLYLKRALYNMVEVNKILTHR